jgi:hypothetical protein
MIDPLIGLRVQLKRTVDIPCCACGTTDVVIGRGADPHTAALYCASCDRRRGRLPKSIVEFLANLISRFGRPSTAITIRNSQFFSANTTAPSGASVAAQHLHPETGD